MTRSTSRSRLDAMVEAGAKLQAEVIVGQSELDSTPADIWGRQCSRAGRPGAHWKLQAPTRQNERHRRGAIGMKAARVVTKRSS